MHFSAFDRAIAQARLDLRRGLWVLATTASTTPFLGLLGTVVGMAYGFRAGCGGQRWNCNAAILMAQSEALFPTLLGLLIAIPSYWGYHYLNNWCNALCRQLDWPGGTRFSR